MANRSRSPVERLECRQLLSASLNAATGLLTLHGTSANDVVTVVKSGNAIKVVEGKTNYSFAASAVKSIKADLAGGADRVSIDKSVTAPATIAAGAGSDTLAGGGGRTTFLFGTVAASVKSPAVYTVSPGGGGTALDFSGLPAADPVTVNLTSDTSLAGFGISTVHTASAGQAALITTVVGGAGDDNFTANAGADSLVGGTGYATLVAGAGNDTLVGSGPATDYVFFPQPLPTVYTLSQARAGQNVLDFSNLPADDPVTANTLYDLMAAYTNVQIHDARPGQYVNFDQIYGGQGPDLITANNVGDTILGGPGDETINGGTGADFIYCGSGNIVVSGEGGADTIFGGSGHDVLFATDFSSDPTWASGTITPAGKVPVSGVQIYAGSGPTSVVGGAGDDTLVGGSGADTIHGLGGDDYIIGGGRGSVLFGDDGNDTITAGQGDTTISGGNGQDQVSGGTVGGSSTFIDKNLPDDAETAAADAVIDPVALTADAVAADQGTGPDDYPLLGTPGLGDIVLGKSANTTIIGGLGDDTLRGGDGPATIVAGSGFDLLVAGNGADAVQGGDGEDTIASGGGPDVLTGGLGNDVFLNVNGYADTVTGGAGFNIAQVDPTGTSILTNIQVLYQPFDGGGGAGNALPATVHTATADLVTPAARPQMTPAVAPPAATLAGGVLRVGSATFSGNQTITVSQDGNNVVTVTQANVGVQQFSGAGIGEVVVTGGPGNDNIDIGSLAIPANVDTGGGAANYVTGGSGNDTLTGGAGSDTIVGGGGSNVISGGAGNNLLYGGTGNDVINGGPGSDWIYTGAPNFSRLGDGESDTINGGSGTEKLDLAGDADPETIRLDQGTVRDNVTGAITYVRNVRNLWAGAGNDLIVGSPVGGVLLNAGSGNDSVYGISASDVLYGGLGNDYFFDTGKSGYTDLLGDHAGAPGNVSYYNAGNTIITPSVDASDIRVPLQNPPG